MTIEIEFCNWPTLEAAISSPTHMTQRSGSKVFFCLALSLHPSWKLCVCVPELATWTAKRTKLIFACDLMAVHISSSYKTMSQAAASTLNSSVFPALLYSTSCKLTGQKCARKQARCSRASAKYVYTFTPGGYFYSGLQELPLDKYFE